MKRLFHELCRKRNAGNGAQTRGPRPPLAVRRKNATFSTKEKRQRSAKILGGFSRSRPFCACTLTKSPAEFTKPANLCHSNEK
jgi:hypothetical protein